jgi:hypothetical protein
LEDIDIDNDSAIAIDSQEEFVQKNPCRELRKLLGMSQVEFSRLLIDVSYPSVRNYEKHPEDTPAAVINQIISLATERGYADWAVVLKSDNWRVVNVLQPGETLITAPKAGAAAPVPPAGGADRAALHGLLDEILNSGDPDAIEAVVPNLSIFAKWVRSRPKSVPAKKKRA